MCYVEACYVINNTYAINPQSTIVKKGIQMKYEIEFSDDPYYSNKKYQAFAEDKETADALALILSEAGRECGVLNILE